MANLEMMTVMVPRLMMIGILVRGDDESHPVGAESIRVFCMVPAARLGTEDAPW
jgi:hypothetical protein